MYRDKNKSRYFSKTKFCISNVAWKEAVDGSSLAIQTAGMNAAHAQAAPSQKMPLYSLPWVLHWYVFERNHAITVLTRTLIDNLVYFWDARQYYIEEERHKEREIEREEKEKREAEVRSLCII